MKFAVHFSSASDRWVTPRDLYAALDAEFQFDFDPCPLDGNGDGLAPLFCVWRGKRVFCNPSYGRKLREWLERGLEADLAVFLLPARTDTRWFHEIVLQNAAEIRFLKGRLRFGDSQSAAPFPSIVVVFQKGNVPATSIQGLPTMNTEESSANAQYHRTSLYFVCEACNAKWFSPSELMLCPRCGVLAASKENVIPGWFGSRRNEMRITRKSYEKARAAVAAAREQLKLVKVWEDAVRQLGNLGNQQLVAVTLNEDGSLRTECELVTGRRDSEPSKSAVAEDPHRGLSTEESSAG